MSSGEMIPIDDMPGAAASASDSLKEALLQILGDDLVAMWLHGGTTFPDRPARPGDLDVCAVIKQATPSERQPMRWQADGTSRPSRILAAQESIGRRHRVAFDALYVLADEVVSGRLPPRAFRRSHREAGWAIYRAHWLAGQYVHLFGRQPADLVIPPTRAEILHALDREVEHLERHVLEGDSGDPFEATYAILNGCRIAYTIDTGNPVISKRSAGAWGLEHLAERWRDPINAATRSYDGEGSSADFALLGGAMGPFVEEVRGRLPAGQSRSRARPRWS